MMKKISMIFVCIMLLTISANVVSLNCIDEDTNISQIHQDKGKKSFIIGRITNFETDEENNVIRFNALNIQSVSLSPFDIKNFESGEQITISKRFVGILTPKVIIGFSNFLSFENYSLFFKSSVLDLLNYSIEEVKNESGDLIQLNLDGVVENKLNHIVNVEMVAEFLDINNYNIGKSTYEIDSLRVKPEPGSSTSFHMGYDGSDVEDITYIWLYVYEI